MKVYEYIVRLKDQASDKANRLANSFSSGRGRIDQFNRSLRETESSAGNLGGSLSGLVGRFLGPAALVVGLTMGVNAMSDLGAQAESTRVSFQVLMGSVEKGNKLLGELKEYANVTPYISKDVLESGKTLLGFGVNADKILPTMKMLGDVAMGDAERLGRLSLVYGQVTAAGKLMGQDLLQLINVGFNPMQIMSQKTGKSMGELRKLMEDGAITSKDVALAFKMATSEGGLFFDMTNKQAETFSGKMSTIEDKLQTSFSKLGEGLNRGLMPILDKILEVMDRADAVGYEMKQKKSSGEQLEFLRSNYEQYQNSEGALKEYFEKEILSKYPIFGQNHSGGVATDLSGSKIENYIDALQTGMNKLSPRASAMMENEKLLRQIDDLQATMKLGKSPKGNMFDDLFGWNKLSNKDYIDDLAKMNELQKQISDNMDKAKSSTPGPFDPMSKSFNLLQSIKDNTFQFDGANPKKGRKLGTGINNITGGGKQAINVTINVAKLIGIETIEKITSEKGMEEMKKELETAAIEIMLRTVNSANYATTQ